MKASSLIVPVSAVGLILVACRAPEITSPRSAHARVGEQFKYQITASRQPTSFDASVPPPRGLAVDPRSGLISGVPAENGDFQVTVRARNERGEGTRAVRLTVTPADGPSPLPPPDSHDVVEGRELFITNPAVLGSKAAGRGGAWHIRSVLQQLAGPERDVEAVAEAWFNTWTANSSIPGSQEAFVQRPWVTAELREAWRADRIRLIAIVNRMDLAQFKDGNPSEPPISLGEGRFIYELVNTQGQSLPFTLIFEFGLPMRGEARASLLEWARRWHALGRAELGGPNEFSAAYLAELETVTREFVGTNTLNQIRSNDFLDRTDGAAKLWELREFHRTAAGQLAQVPVALTPAIGLANSPALGATLRAQEPTIVGGGRLVLSPAEQAAVAPVSTPGFKWQIPGASPRANFIASFNTCNGCHGGDSETFFQHLGAVAPNRSKFLNGVIDLAQPLPPAGNARRQHNEMADRRRLLAAFAQDIRPSIRSFSDSNADLSDLIKARAGRPH